MRLRSLSLQNYRIHRQFQFVFDPSRTLIGGPNECGKSTLVEAIHRAFFLRAKGNTEHHRAMASIHGGDPEVEIEFTLGGTDYRLKKRFGSHGATTLTPAGRETLSGEAAEAELARLLGAPANISKNALPDQWSHIWVRQGLSHFDPTGHATAQQAPLLQRLQEIGGAAAVQSDLDARLAAQFRTEKEKIYRDDGKTKAGSDLSIALTQHDEAQAEKLKAEERHARLTGAIREFESASLEITSGTANIINLEKQQQAADERVSRVDGLRVQEREQLRSLETVKSHLAEAEAVEKRIGGIRTDLQRRTAALAPSSAEAGQLEATARKLRSAAGDSGSRYEAASEAVRGARLRRDYLAAAVRFFEKTEDLQHLLSRQGKIEALQNQLASHRDELARLPALDDKGLSALHALEQKVSRAEAALQTMAAGLEVIASDQSVIAGDTVLQAGESLELLTETEIRIGDSVRMIVRPGGGSGLAHARTDHQEAKESLRHLLEKIGVTTTAEASEVVAKRRELVTQIDSTTKSIRDADGEILPGKIASAKEAVSAAEADMLRRAQPAGNLTRPTTLAEAKQFLTEGEATLGKAEQSEATLKVLRSNDETAATTAERRAVERRASIEAEQKAVTELEIQLRTVEETHGDSPSRTAKLSSFRDEYSRAEAALDTTRKTLSELNADHAAADAARLLRAVTMAREAEAAAQTRRAVAESRLRSDGSENPQADLEFATARLEAAQSRLSTVRRRADAIRLLDQLFTEEQRSLATRFTQPLADRISGYLECIFGSHSRANVVLNDNEFQGLELVRLTHGGGAFGFDSLSGGTKEQVAAAMRLAMAEILSRGFGDCLPVIFDDAFAYSDPDRVQTLQRMLDLAAVRGLQVIVLTCAPSDYAALGAKQISLASAETSIPPATPRPAGETSGTTATEPQSTSDEERLTFLSALSAAGGTSGNIALRQALGWSEPAYEAMRQSLLASGKITAGKGRGGSVSLTTA